jgi:hypothetical protein
MNLLLAFTPFIVFVIVERLVSILVGLAAGAVAACALLVRDLVTPGHSVKLLEAGTLLLFGGLTLLQLLMGEQWSIADVRLRVDAGLLLIVLLTMVLGRPFSLQYARERGAPEYWEQPDFLRVNYVISAAWALAFGCAGGRRCRDRRRAGAAAYGRRGGDRGRAVGCSLVYGTCTDALCAAANSRASWRISSRTDRISSAEIIRTLIPDAPAINMYFMSSSVELRQIRCYSKS